MFTDPYVRAGAATFLFAALVAFPPRSLAETSRVQPVYTPVPLFGSAPVSPKALTAAGPYVVPMTGPWKFAIARGQTIDGVYVGTSALARIATASSTSGGVGYWSGAISNAIDGDTGTHWSAAAGSVLPQWFELDLGAVRTVPAVQLDWGDPRLRYRYLVQGSVDGAAWSTLSDRTAADASGAAGGNIPVAGAGARYLRVTIVGATWAPGGRPAARRRFGTGPRNVPIQIAEIGVVVVENGAKVAWLPSPSHDGFDRPDFDDRKWDTLAVPSNWEISGYSRPTYNDVDDAVGEYRRWVTVPARFAGKRIFWRFDGVFDSAEVFVNGRRAGYHESGYTAFDVDLTGLVVAGRPNLFAVRVCKKTSTVDCDTGDYEAMGGIYRQTFLYATPQTHIGDLTVRTDVDAATHSSDLHLAVRIDGPVARGSIFDVKLYDQTGHAVGLPKILGPLPGASGPTSAVNVSIPVEYPRLWSAEQPNLYTVVATLAAPTIEGNETVEQRFGFREISYSPQGVLLWNGVPIKCAGTCRHEIYPTLGAALDDNVWKRDIALMKSANINAIRTSHYNDASRFLDLCDRSGFYILDEVPYCWIGAKINDPRYAPALLERAEETFARDKNRPAVLAWSCGNENGYGQNAVTVMQWLHAHDPTRPAFSSQLWVNVPGQSFIDAHYPTPADVARTAAGGESAKAPVVFTEQPHVFCAAQSLAYDYGLHAFWGSVLKRSWDTIQKYPIILGSFIWEWQNQPIVSTWSDSAPGHRGKPAVWFENDKGVVDGYRNPKPEWWQVKMTYSPVRIPIREVQIGPDRIVRIPVQNRYSFTNLDKLACSVSCYRDGRATSTRNIRLWCPPLCGTTLKEHIPTGTTQVGVVFTDSERVAPAWVALVEHASASDSANFGGIAGLKQVAAVRLAVDGAASPQPPAAAPDGGRLAIDNAGGSLRVANKQMAVVFQTATGQIESWTVDGHTLLTGGPQIDLGQSHELVDQFGQNSLSTFIGPGSDLAVGAASTAASANGEDIVVVATAPVSIGSGGIAGELTTTYDVEPNAQIAMHWSIAWSDADMRAWEDGVTLTLPKHYSRMRWLRRTRFSAYPAGYIGAPSGMCTPADVGFSASKRRLGWLSLTDPSGHGIALIASGEPLLARARSTADGIALDACSDEAVDFELSSAWATGHDITLTKGKPLTGGFLLRAL